MCSSCCDCSDEKVNWTTLAEGHLNMRAWFRYKNIKKNGDGTKEPIHKKSKIKTCLKGAHSLLEGCRKFSTYIPIILLVSLNSFFVVNCPAFNNAVYTEALAGLTNVLIQKICRFFFFFCNSTFFFKRATTTTLKMWGYNWYHDWYSEYSNLFFLGQINSCPTDLIRVWMQEHKKKNNHQTCFTCCVIAPHL